MSQNTWLTTLICGYTYLEELDVSQNTKLTELRCCETELRSLDISKNVYLETLEAWGGHLVNLDVSNNPRLKYLDLRYHDMCALDSIKGLENCTELEDDAFFFEPQNGPTGQHIPGTAWETDGTSHWHTCTVCGAEQDRADHVYGGGQDAVCDTCGCRRAVSPPTSSSSGGSSYSYSNYTITASAGEGGRIDPSGRVSLREGRDKTFTIVPNEGYEIADVLVDGESMGTVAEYSFQKVSRAHTIEAVFRETDAGHAPCPRDESCPIWPYADANAAEWYHDGVHYCIENDLIIGYVDGRFGPDETLTRGMLVRILYNEAGRPGVSGSAPFNDVDSDAWYADAVAWAAEEGIVKGYEKGAFGPEDPTTCEQFAAVLCRCAGSPDASDFPLPYDDGKNVSGYALDALRWAVGKEIMRGTDEGELAPQREVTRAEAAAMLHRYLMLEQ